MPKPNKPRHKVIPEIEAKADADAAAFLDGLSGVQEVTHFADGSMSIVHLVDGRLFDTGIEFNAPLTAAIARRLRAAGVEVKLV